MLGDYFNYKQFGASQTNVVNVYADLGILMFLCQSLHLPIYCEYVANLCVLSLYNLERFSPCNHFYAAQTAFAGGIGVDGYQSRVTPFLFYPKGKSTVDDLDKTIDQRYRYGRASDDFFDDVDVTDEISMLVVGHALDGDLRTIEPFRVSDFNFCASRQGLQGIHFGEDLLASCRLELRDLVERGERRPWLMNLYLNYTENKVGLMKAVPILIRNAFSHNQV